VPAAVGGGTLIQKTISTGLADPSPYGFGEAATYAKVGMFHPGVCADAVGESKIGVAKVNMANVTKMVIAIFFRNGCIFILLNMLWLFRIHNGVLKPYLILML
jgi:hypothetical protein